MAVSIEASGEGHVLIEGYWPHGQNEDNYARIAQERLDRAEALDELCEQLRAAKTQVGEASMGATSVAFDASLDAKIAQFSRLAEDARAMSSGFAMASQNIFNTKNLLNALAVDYQNKWDDLTAANIATGGTQPEIQAAIASLKTIGHVAAQVVAGGFGAAHECISGQIMASSAMSAPPVMMPPNMYGAGGYAGWGPSPYMPQVYAQPGFYGQAGSPMLAGDYGAGIPGGLLSSLVNSAPAMMSMASPYAATGMPLSGVSGVGPSGWLMLQQAAQTVTAGIAGAAQALGDALGEGPLADHMPDDTPLGADTPATGTPEGDNKPAGGTPDSDSGDPAAGSKGATPPVHTAGFHGSIAGVDVSAHGELAAATAPGGFAVAADGGARIETHLSSADTDPTASMRPTASTATIAPASPAAPAPAQSSFNFYQGPSGGVSTPNTVPRSSAAPRPAPATTPRTQAPHAPMDATHTDSTTQMPSPTTENSPVYARGVAVVALVTRYVGPATPVAVAVYPHTAVFTTPDCFGQPTRHDHVFPSRVTPLATHVATLDDTEHVRWWGEYAGCADVCAVLHAAITQGMIDTPELIITTSAPNTHHDRVYIIKPEEITGVARELTIYPTWSYPQPVEPAPADTLIRRAQQAADQWGVPRPGVIDHGEYADGMVKHRWQTEVDTYAPVASAWWCVSTARTALDNSQPGIADSVLRLIPPRHT